MDKRKLGWKLDKGRIWTRSLVSTLILYLVGIMRGRMDRLKGWIISIYYLVQKILERMNEEGLSIHLGSPFCILINWRNIRKDGWSIKGWVSILTNYLLTFCKILTLFYFFIYFNFILFTLCTHSTQFYYELFLLQHIIFIIVSK